MAGLFRCRMRAASWLAAVVLTVSVTGCDGLRERAEGKPSFEPGPTTQPTRVAPAPARLPTEIWYGSLPAITR